METSNIAMISLGFSLGLMHAFDADHVMAVSTLSHARQEPHKTLRYCANWALGHAGVLLFSGAIMLSLGLNIPGTLQQIAELMVGVVLITLGVLCIWRFNPQCLTMGKDRQSSLLVGVLHGLAGSAPILALVPALAQGDVIVAMLYLLLFSLGVMLSMLAFGLGFGSLQHYLRVNHEALFNGNRYIIASSSIIMGVYWMSQAF